MKFENKFPWSIGEFLLFRLSDCGLRAKVALFVFLLISLACSTRLKAQTPESPSRLSFEISLPVITPAGSSLSSLKTIEADSDRSQTCYPETLAADFHPASQDEIWLIDGRDIHCNPADLSRLSVFRLNECGCRWDCHSLETLIDKHTTDRTKTTFLYVHGDRTDDFYACRRGLEFYQNVFCSSSEPRPGVRFVIWSWRSDRQFYRPSKDYSFKAVRAFDVGKSMASFLTQFGDRKLVLVGYSLGCQAFLIALEEMSCALSLADANGSSAFEGMEGYRVCLIAPALEPYYVAQHHCRFAGAELVAKTDIFDNSADRALKCARIMGWHRVPGGGTSIQVLASRGNLPLSNISIYDLATAIGKRHNIRHYSAAPIIGCRLREMIGDPLEGGSQSNSPSVIKR
jgi:hypothetical protein